MTETVLIDNDVLLKCAAFSVVSELVSATTTASGPPAMLGVARFVVARRLARDPRLSDRGRSLAAFEALIREIGAVEPDAEELLLAAGLEELATRQGLELDGGESQLTAILIRRGYALLLTGDKRAIQALAGLKPDRLAGKLASLEQLFCAILSVDIVARLRAQICAEGTLDTALTICMGCYSRSPPDLATIEAALHSYIDDLRRASGDLMIAQDGLGALAA